MQIITLVFTCLITRNRGSNPLRGTISIFYNCMSTHIRKKTKSIISEIQKNIFQLLDYKLSNIIKNLTISLLWQE
jgi:hypothetical protein